MKKTLCLIVLSFIYICAFSQEKNPHVEQGSPRKVKLKDLSSKLETIGQDKEFIYFLQYPIDFESDAFIQREIKDFYIVKFDKENLQQLNREEVQVENNNRKRQVYGASQIGTELRFFTGFQNELHKKHYLFVQSISKETLKVETNERKIGEIDYSGINKYKNTHFDFKLSSDSSKVLVHYSVIDEDGWILRHGLYVYDNKFQLLWEKDRVTIGKDAEVFQYRDFFVDNDGNVYAVTRKYYNKLQYELAPFFSTQSGFSHMQYYPNLPNYQTNIFRISNNGNDVEKINIDVPNKFIRSVGIGVNKQGDVFCAGLYSKTGMISPEGAFIFELDIDSGTKINLGMRQTTFEENDTSMHGETLRNFHQCVGNFSEWDPYDYIVSEVMFDQNDNPFFVAEQHIKAKLFTNNSIHTFPVYGDLLVVKSNSNCHIDLVSRIQKRQYCMRPHPFIITSIIPHKSYLLMEFEGQLAFIFKDYYLSSRVTVRVDEGEESLIKIDNNGEQIKQVLHDFDCKKCPNIMPRTAIKISSNEMIFYSLAIKRRSYSLNKLIWE